MHIILVSETDLYQIIKIFIQLVNICLYLQGHGRIDIDSIIVYVRTSITKLGKDFGAQKLKFGFTRQRFCIGTMRRLMYFVY